MAVVTEDFSFPKLIPTPTSTATKKDDDDDNKNNNNNKNDNKSPASQLTLSSPSLWRISSLVYPDDDCEEQENDDQRAVVSRKNSVKSFSDAETDRDSEERMDSLWEDFNEQEVVVRPLQRVSSLDNRKRKIIGSSNYINYYPSRSDDIIIDVFDHDHDHRNRYFDRTAGIGGSDLGRDHGIYDDDRGLKLKIPERRGNKSSTVNTNLTRHRKRTSMVVLLRAFRKLFLLQNLARNKKN